MGDLSEGRVLFASRQRAAELLAAKLQRFQGSRPLVLAVPRGAVPMARIVAEHLEGDLDIVLVHKLGAPGNPELAIGAVGETGEALVSDLARDIGATAEYIEAETRAQQEALRERRQRYSAGRASIDPRGRTVIVVDDGAATGATLKAALQLLRESAPSRLIAALGVAPTATVTELERLADEVVCLATPEPFFAVGEFFADFSEVSDEEVVRILRGSASERERPGRDS